MRLHIELSDIQVETLLRESMAGLGPVPQERIRQSASRTRELVRLAIDRRLAEREDIVAWLRRVGQARDDRADVEWAKCLFEAAEFVEAGEHLKFLHRTDEGGDAPCR